MSSEYETVAVETVPESNGVAAPAKKPARKPARKAPAKGKVAPKAGKSAAKPGANGEAAHRKDFSDGQVRTLRYLAKGGLRTLTQVADSAFNGHKGQTFNAVGPADPAKQANTAARKGCRPGLLMLGLIRTKVEEVSGKKTRLYEITAKGKSLAARLEAPKKKAAK